MAKKDVTQSVVEDPIWNPRLNHNVISIVKQPDGNFIGYMFKNGKYIEVRQGDPNTVLQLLITHG